VADAANGNAPLPRTAATEFFATIARQWGMLRRIIIPSLLGLNPHPTGKLIRFMYYDHTVEP